MHAAVTAAIYGAMWVARSESSVSYLHRVRFWAKKAERQCE